MLLAGRIRCRDGSFSTEYVRIYMNTHQRRHYLIQHVWHETYAIIDSHSNYMRSSTDAHPHTHAQYIEDILCDPQLFSTYVLQVAKSKLNFTNKLYNR
jgi:hypothetical protein